MITSLAALIVFASTSPGSQDEKKPSIEIVVARDKAGDALFPHGEGFEVRIGNLTDQPLTIWEERCQPGHRMLTFGVKGAEGEASVVRKREVRGDAWSRFPPRTRTIPPKGSQTRAVDLSNFFWGEREWQDVPEPNSGERIEIRAVFEVAPSDEAKTQGVWTGRIESPPVTVLVINPKLKTPHDYLRNACPRQALRVLKADPTWARKTDENQCTPLHHAARFGAMEVVVWLLESGADVNATCYNRFTALYFAASEGRLDLVKYLIQKGAQIEAPSNGGTPLQAAAGRHHREVVKALVEAGAAYDLDTAISLSDEERVKGILQKDPDVARRENALHSACRTGHAGIVALLIEKGADPNDSRRHWHDPPLLSALEHEEIVKLLLEKGADPKVRLNIKGLAFGSTLLHEAARRGHLESARLLIERGADVEAVIVDDFMGKPAKETVFSPLHAAASGGQAKLVELLVDRKADLKRRTSAGQSALELAGAQIRPVEDDKTREENRRYAEVVKLLAARGLEVDLFTAIALGDLERATSLVAAKPGRVRERDLEGALPLHKAVQMDQRAIVEKLLEAGADVNAPGRYGYTPLLEAGFWGRPELICLLLDRKADPGIKAERGATALSEAERVLPHSSRKQDYEEVIKLLKERGRR